MTGVEWILLLIGSVFMVGSFFVTEKLSPSELNQIAELSEEELKRIIDKELLNAATRIEEAIDDQIDASSDKVERALEKETNDKIMAISEYSDTVIENMNKTHNEIMFLYSMLNDKHAELTGMTSDLQRLAADVRSLEEDLAAQQAHKAAEPAVKPQPAVRVNTQAKAVQAKPQPVGKPQPEAAQASADEEKEEEKQPEKAAETGIQTEILNLKKMGMTEVQIAKKLGIGIGEVRLVNGLYRGEKDS